MYAMQSTIESQSLPKGPGTYVLVMQLSHMATVTAGRLGTIVLEPGYYFYVGSALGGLRSRLARHLRTEKRHHWHIDYLLDQAHIVEIWYAQGKERVECNWAEALCAQEGVKPAHKGFGASDCHCATHLFFATQQTTLAGTRGKLGIKKPVQRWQPSEHGQWNSDIPIER